MSRCTFFIMLYNIENVERYTSKMFSGSKLEGTILIKNLKVEVFEQN